MELRDPNDSEGFMANAYVLSKLENDTFGAIISYFLLSDILFRNSMTDLPSLTPKYVRAAKSEIEGTPSTS